MEAPLERRMPWRLLFGRIGGAARGRVICSEEGISLEWNLRLNYRGLDPVVVVLLCLGSAGVVFLFLLRLLGPR